MTPETTRQYRDDLARNRYERDAYAKRASDRRKDAIEHRRNRRWLDALVADGRASEYRQTRDQFAAEAARIRKLLSA